LAVETAIGTIREVSIEEQMKTAYLDYAMSVITSRALPDVRDGLKPVQRRILYAMHEMGLFSDRPYRKSARIVGEVLGKYHPHGDAAVYDAMVRLAQGFSTRYPLVDGQGNFGSIDGDSAAAMRYTEVRMAGLAEMMLEHIHEDTVDFQDNFDGSLQEPEVLPAGLPILLVNGASGIAVGMATSVPPHNLGEICDALVYVVDRVIRRQRVSLKKLLDIVRGPDFPTGGLVYRYRQRKGEDEPVDTIRKAYATGRGKLLVRAKTHVEKVSRGRHAIVVSEIPYQVHKSSLIQRIADLARNGKVDSIADLRDESDRTGMRLVIELKRTADPSQVLSQLFKGSALQTTFSVNLIALVEGEPRVLNLEKALRQYVQHRRTVITRRGGHELDVAKRREHVLAGLLIALADLDAVIDTIRRSRTARTARGNLQRGFKLTRLQAEAILEMPLRRLAALERRKVAKEHAETRKRIEELVAVLSDVKKILGLIKDDLRVLKEAHADGRRTRIVNRPVSKFTERDLIPDETVLVTLTRRGYIKRERVDGYRSPRRGGPGVNGMATKDGDAIENMLLANTLDRLLLFTEQGRVFSLSTHEIPEGKRGRNGKPLSGLIDTRRGERPITIIAIPPDEDAEERPKTGARQHLIMATKKGMVKRVPRENFVTACSSGLTAVKLDRGDQLGWVKLTRGAEDVVLVTRKGRAIRFSEAEVRPMSRAARGVRGIKLGKGDSVIGMGVSREGSQLLVITEQGYGKRTSLTRYSRQKRYGTGLITARASGISGALAASCLVRPMNQIAVISASGTVTRLEVRSVPARGRSTKGSRLISLKAEDSVASVARIPSERD